MNLTYTFNQRKLLSLFFLSAVLIFSLSGCDIFNSNDDDDDNNNNEPDPDSTQTSFETMEEDDDLSDFVQLILDAGAEGDFDAEGSFTVFAPENSAFENLPDTLLENLSEDQLEELINYHLLDEEVSSEGLSDSSSVRTSSGESVYIESNGEIELNRSAQITDADIETSSGFINKIDEILLPNSLLDVLSIAEKRSDLSQFVCNCTSGRTGLDSVLEDPEADFTVFAPNNDAFENFDHEELSDEELREILEYHIIETSYLSDDLSDGEALTTRNGSELTVSVDGEDISLNEGSATVLEVDYEGLNGVVYVIDTVLTPPGE